MCERTKILDFIENFKGAKDTFLFGCCYWFSFILNERFGGTTIYLPVENHYVQQIGDRLYDVSGDVTDKYKGAEIMKWSDMQERDSSLYKRLVRDCINKEAFDSG